MLALGIIILASVIIILFARNWGVDTGPGVMVKVKIFITHVQVPTFTMPSLPMSLIM